MEFQLILVGFAREKLPKIVKGTGFIYENIF